MLTLKFAEEVASAPAGQSTLETPTLGADPSVLSTLTATEHLPAEGTTNATTPAPEPVASMPFAKSSTTTRPAAACLVTSEIPSAGAA